LNDQHEIAAAITLNVQLGAARTLQLSTYLPRDADAATYNAVLDKLATAADRQEAKGRLLDLNREVKQVHKLIGQHTEDYNRIEAKNVADWDRVGKKGEPRLSPQEKNAQEQAKITVKRYREELMRLEGEIAQAKEIIDARQTGTA